MNAAWGRAALGLILALAVFGLHQPIPTTYPAERHEVFLPEPEVAKLAALGFEAVLSDYYWIQAMYKVGASIESPDASAAYIGKIIEVVTTLDPYVGHPYRFAAIWLTDNTESVLKGNQLLEKAIQYHPDDWRNHFYLGFNLFYYLGENEKAADALETAASMEGSPAYLPRLVVRLRSQSSDLESATIFLQQLVNSAPSAEERTVYQGALDEIEVETKARFLERARVAYVELYRRDIEQVSDLVGGEHPILSALPAPEPDELPAALRKGDRWILDEKTGRITSSYYGRRYEVNLTERDRYLRDQFNQNEDSEGGRI
jgi:hypothetical protein